MSSLGPVHMPVDGTVLGSTPLLAIVRFPEGGDVVGAIEALVEGGVERLEVTADTPGGFAAVEHAASSGRTVGVGTVLSGDQVRAAAAAGARFVVSPGLVHEVIDTAWELGLEPVPGVFTATEILAATAAGARVLKLFPASCGGPSYLRALRGPFPDTCARRDRAEFESTRSTTTSCGRDRRRARQRARRAGRRLDRTRSSSGSRRMRREPWQRLVRVSAMRCGAGEGGR